MLEHSKSLELSRTGTQSMKRVQNAKNGEGDQPSTTATIMQYNHDGDQ
jgi:hypothetical protein